MPMTCETHSIDLVSGAGIMRHIDQSTVARQAWTTKPWIVVLAWLIVCTGAWTSAILVNQALNQTNLSLFGVSGLVAGSVIGVVLLSAGQSIILHPYIVSRLRWISGSIAAAALGVIAGFIAGAGSAIFGILISTAVTPFEPPSGPDLAPLPLFSGLNVILSLAGAVGGAVVGGIQALCFRQRIKYRKWWVLASAVGAAIANFLLLPRMMSPVVNGVVMGVAYGLITAPAIIVMLRNSSLGLHQQPHLTST
jgi:hypothetical protein